MPSLMESLFGRKEKFQQIPTQSPQQNQFLNQILGLLGGQGIGGAGSAFDYWQDILGGDTSAFEAPLMREFQEQIVPGIAERFTGVGGQRSSAFGQQLGAAGAGLAERLGALRGGLKGQAAQGLLGGLQGLGGLGLGTSTFENVFRPGTSGLFGSLGSGVGGGLGQAGGMGGILQLLSLLGMA